MAAQHPPVASLDTDADAHPGILSKLRRRHLVAAASLCLIAFVMFEGYRAWNIAGDVREGRELLRIGEARMDAQRLDANAQDLASARADFALAGDRFASADRAMSSDPAATIARRLPWVGGQIAAAHTLAEIGQDASAIGVAGVDAIAAFQSVRYGGDRSLPELTPELIASVDPHIIQAQAALADIDASRDEMSSGALVPPLRSALAELDERRARLHEMFENYGTARDFAPEFLGFDGPRTYLVLAHNNSEMLPTGGLVSVVGTLVLDEGRVEELEFQDAVQMGDDWMLRDDFAYIEPPAPLRQYLLKDHSWNLTTSNWSPDFPAAAREAARFYAIEGGARADDVDGVIAVNVTTLERLLGVTGPVEIPEFDVLVNEDNAFALTSEHTRVPFRPAGDRKEFAALLADEVLQRVLHPQAGMWSPLVETVQRLGDEKDLMMYSFDPEQQEQIERMEWDGGLAGTEETSDYLMVVDASINSTKLNWIVGHEAAIDVKLSDDGTATTTVTLDYDNPFSEWAHGRDPYIIDKLMLGGQYGGYVRLLTPAGSRIVSVTDGHGEIGLEEIGEEQGLASFGRFFAMQADDRARLTFTYETPPVVVQDGDVWTYTLRLQRQSGWEFDSVSLDVDPQAGMRQLAVLVDGESVEAGQSDAIDLDLSRDRLVTVRFERE